MNLIQLQQQFNPAFRLCQRDGIKTMTEDRLNEIKSILQKGEATHNERIWLCGYLHWIGFSAEEVMDIIDKNNQWYDFDSGMTWYQICSIFKIKINMPGGTRRRRARKIKLPPLSIAQQERIQRAKEMMDREKWHDGLVVESVTTLEPDEDDGMEPTFENGCLFGYRRREK
jgi:hypothetical protein